MLHIVCYCLKNAKQLAKYLAPSINIQQTLALGNRHYILFKGLGVCTDSWYGTHFPDFSNQTVLHRSALVVSVQKVFELVDVITLDVGEYVSNVFLLTYLESFIKLKVLLVHLILQHVLKAFFKTKLVVRLPCLVQVARSCTHHWPVDKIVPGDVGICVLLNILRHQNMPIHNQGPALQRLPSSFVDMMFAMSFFCSLHGYLSLCARM